MPWPWRTDTVLLVLVLKFSRSARRERTRLEAGHQRKMVKLSKYQHGGRAGGIWGECEESRRLRSISRRTRKGLPQAGKEKVLIHPQRQTQQEKTPAPVRLGEVCCMNLGRIAALNQQFHPKAGCFPHCCCPPIPRVETLPSCTSCM